MYVMGKKDRNPECVQANWEIPTHLREAFTDFCKVVGTLAKDDCAGALYLWQWLPGQIREWAKLSAKEHGEPRQFWRILRDGLESAAEEGLSEYLSRQPLRAPNLTASLSATPVTEMSDFEAGQQVVRDAAARSADRGGSSATDRRGSPRSHSKLDQRKAV